MSFRDRRIALGLDIPVSDVSTSNEVAFNVGGGIEYAMSDRMVARTDLRRFQSGDIARESLALLRRDRFHPEGQADESVLEQ